MQRNLGFPVIIFGHRRLCIWGKRLNMELKIENELVASYKTGIFILAAENNV